MYGEKSFSCRIDRGMLGVLPVMLTRLSKSRLPDALSGRFSEISLYDARKMDVESHFNSSFARCTSLIRLAL